MKHFVLYGSNLVRTPPEIWAEVRNCWQRLHLVRTVLALLTLATLLTAHVAERWNATPTPHPSRSAELTASHPNV